MQGKMILSLKGILVGLLALASVAWGQEKDAGAVTTPATKSETPKVIARDSAGSGIAKAGKADSREAALERARKVKKADKELTEKQEKETSVTLDRMRAEAKARRAARAKLRSGGGK